MPGYLGQFINRLRDIGKAPVVGRTTINIIGDSVLTATWIPPGISPIGKVISMEGPLFRVRFESLLGEQPRESVLPKDVLIRF